MNKRNIIIIVSILTFIVMIGGISYSYFVYNKDIGDITLNTGDISIDLSGINGNRTLTNVIPMGDNDGKTSSDYFDFTVNAIVDTERIYYEVYLMPKDNNTLDTSYLKTYLTNQNNVEIKGVTTYNDLGNSEVENGKALYKGINEVNQNGESKTETKDFRLRLWIDEDYSEQASKTFEFDIYLYAKNVNSDFELPYGANLLRNAITNKESQGGTCSNITWTDTEDNITYLSGTNDCIDMNYVWYSGKLWRITAIYPDDAMKMVTENNITSISFNESDVNFYTNENTTSYIYQWLNEDFYDTLYNASEFIDSTKQWNATKTVGISTKPAETNMVDANVGLLNSYEYYNAYRNANESTNYLNIGYFWWLLNPYNTSYVWSVHYIGGGSHSPLPNNMNGGRPSIYLKSGIEFIGSGTKDSPYKIVGDKDTGKTNDLINTRLSGEYVKLVNNDSNQTFRIIGVENNKTKIIAMDYADNKGTRKFATSTGSANTLWGSGTTTGTDTWYDYLNNTYLPNLKTTYDELFDSGTYYHGISGYNYKLSVCANTTSGKLKVCDKTSHVGTFNIGLPRYGEMFATQQGTGYSNSIDMWLLNPYNTSYVWIVYSLGNDNYSNPAVTDGVRPTLHLKSTVKIIEGSGTESDPYVVGL